MVQPRVSHSGDPGEPADLLVGRFSGFRDRSHLHPRARSTHRARVMRLLLLALPVAISACGGQPADPGGEVIAPGAPSAGTQANFSADFEEREAVLHDAEQELIRRCMQGAGFEFVTTPSSTIADQERQAASEVPPAFGFDDVATAQRDGYGLAGQTSASGVLPSDKANVNIYEALSQQERTRYDELLNPSLENAVMVRLDDGSEISTPAEGCVADARVALYGDLAEYIELSHVSLNLRNEARSRVEADETYGQALGAWSSCMEDRGFEFAAWFEAYEAALNAPARQIEIAVADTTCAAEVGSVRIGNDLQDKYEQEVLNDREAELIAYGELLDIAVDKAKSSVVGT